MEAVKFIFKTQPKTSGFFFIFSPTPWSHGMNYRVSFSLRIECVALSETVVKKISLTSHSHPSKIKEITPLPPNLQSLC